MTDCGNTTYCEAAGIDVGCLRRGVNNKQETIPEDILLNGCIVEIMHTVNPSWSDLTSWLLSWMGPRLTPNTRSTRVQYFVKKMLERRRVLKKKSQQSEIKSLESDPFVIPVAVPRNPGTKPACLQHSKVGSLEQSHETCHLTPSAPLLTHSAPLLTHSAPLLTHSAPLLTPSAPLLTHSAPLLTHSAPLLTHSAPLLTPSAPLLTHSAPLLTHSAPLLTPTQIPTQASILTTTPNPSTSPILTSDMLKRRYQNDRRLRNAIARDKYKKQKIVELKNLLKQKDKAIIRLQRGRKILLNHQRERLTKLKRIKLPCRHVGVQFNHGCLSCPRYEMEIEQLKGIIESQAKFERHQFVDFMDGSQYNQHVTQCVLSLLELNVANHNISDVIRIVLQLVNVSAKQLPCRTTVENIGKLRQPLAHLNIAATLKEEEDLCLYSDETMKHGRQFETYVVTTTSKEAKLMGIREMKDKSAATNLQTLEMVIADLDTIAKSEGATVAKTIVSHIRNTMSDRAATEKCFHKLLVEYKKAVLSEIIPNWGSLSENMRKSLSTMHHYFCGLHLLVNAAETCSSTLHLYEKHILKTTDQHRFPHEKGSVTEFIRSASKAFSRGGDDKSGCYGKVSAFLSGRGIKQHLIPFRGNRFNILFHNASVLFYLHPHLCDFLQNYWGTPNQLLQSVNRDLQSELCLAGCRALGLLNKLLTKPLWNVIEDNSNILSRNTTYRDLIANMTNTSSQSIIEGTSTFIPCSSPPEMDDVMRALIKPSSSDALTKALLEVIIPDLTTTFQRLLQDQLPGGGNAEKTEELNPESVSVLKHNKIPESVFGRLDYLQHHKPAATIYTHESAIIYSFNGVGKWLDDMTEEERDRVLADASVLRTSSFETFIDRRKKLEEDKIKALQAKAEEMKNLKHKKERERILQTNDIVFHGLWQSASEVDARLNTYKGNKQKIDALKIQLKFRKNVLKQQVTDKKLLMFSLAKKQLNLDELTSNLKEVIQQTAFMADPCLTKSSLTKKKVKHRFDNDIWYVGWVISQVEGFPDWFNITYDCEPDTVYTYQLERDLADSDLVVLGIV